MRAQHAKETSVKDAEIQKYQAQLDELRARVSDVVTRLITHKMNEKDAAEAIRGLGCHIEYLESGTRWVTWIVDSFCMNSIT